MVERFEGKGIWHYLDRVWIVMNSCIKRGLAAEGELPGGLGIMRKAYMLNNRRHMDESPETRENRLVCAYAYAVSEENASCGEIVTAPTCGACGVLPAVLRYTADRRGFSENEIRRAIATAGIIGNVIKTNASISGAECGCQAEIGSASAMAAGALTYLQGGNEQQIADSVAMALKNLLGLVCDPVGGLVEYPCQNRAQRSRRDEGDKRSEPCKLFDIHKKDIVRSDSRDDVSDGQGSFKNIPRDERGRTRQAL